MAAIWSFLAFQLILCLLTYWQKRVGNGKEEEGADSKFIFGREFCYFLKEQRAKVKTK
jgi:hypothetical protein